MSTLSINNLSKRFVGTEAVRNVNLEIRSGEFFSILGPSGCGKTTLLRMIAGFELPSSGSIHLNGRDITNVSPQRRGIGMVFQNYALFPHMTVFENVAFGLETAGVNRKEVRERVMKILEGVQLTEKVSTPVPSLSGGEQQRVAVARALVVEPAVLLFDEPLSNLDVSLRVETREEIRALQRNTGITTIYVTHDQSEAMSLSDRIAVMREGSVEQVATPVQVYEHPVSPFVAQFVGGANLIAATFSTNNNLLTIGDSRVTFSHGSENVPNGNVWVAIKPELISVLSAGNDKPSEAVVEEKEYLGFTTHFVLRTWGTRLRVSAMSAPALDSIRVGMSVSFKVDWSRCNFFART